MRRALALGAASAAAALAPAAAAGAATRPLQPLVDVAPAGAPVVNDRVLARPAAGVQARIAQASSATTRTYSTSDGTRIPVTVSPSYSGADAAQSYVTFLGSLPHGSELRLLRVLIETPAEVLADCGGQPGTLACYVPSRETMIVPGEQASSSDVPVSYVVTHEYGHHLAAHRSNAPLPGLTYGPKLWSSYERVCSRTRAGRLAISQTDRYFDDPGENWAETYARLVYPSRPWDFAQLLKPNEAALAAARHDVFAPWKARRTTTFRGRLSPSRRTQSFALSLRLDGSLTFDLRGPGASNFDLSLRSPAGAAGKTAARGSRDRLNLRLACRSTATERVTLTVVRRSGSGPFSVTARYAG